MVEFYMIARRCIVTNPLCFVFVPAIVYFHRHFHYISYCVFSCNKSRTVYFAIMIYSTTVAVDVDISDRFVANQLKFEIWLTITFRMQGLVFIEQINHVRTMLQNNVKQLVYQNGSSRQLSIDTFAPVSLCWVMCSSTRDLVYVLLSIKLLYDLKYLQIPGSAGADLQ